MKVLVFTAKWIGLHCVEFLLDHYPEDEYLFVVMEPDAGLIAKRLTERQVPFVHLSNESLHEIQQRFGEHHFDFLLNLWGGHIFRRETLRLARRSLNIHPAYLPYCRGRDPVVWAVRYGYPAGVTLHEIADGVDEGPILRREEVPYTFPTTGGELYARVIDRSWRLFCEEWPTLRQGEWEPLPQQPLPEQRTFRRAELLSDRTIDSRKEPEVLAFVQRVLAHDFGDYTAEFEHQEKIYSLRVVLEEKTAK